MDVARLAAAAGRAVKAIVASALCLVVGLGVGYLRAASPEPARTEAQPSAAPRATVREVVHREIVRERVDAVKPEPPLDARVERARLVVERAKTRGTWLESDRETLHDEMEGLPGPMKADIAAAFSDFVNRGELRIETEIPL